MERVIIKVSPGRKLAGIDYYYYSKLIY